MQSLKAAVSQCASGMKDMGVSEMDRVAAVIPNCPEAVIGLSLHQVLGQSGLPVLLILALKALTIGLDKFPLKF
ncbi:MAG: hypothetical protein Ct9H300mP28_08640 [Pseudomonadota bacterium]|nr:MAG: hypothetical protein Ct9H300mP28_08640 [Pseudomonadota bacterium]